MEKDYEPLNEVELQLVELVKHKTNEEILKELITKIVEIKLKTIKQNG